MAVSPKEILDRLSVEDQASADDLEKKIDVYLWKTYKGQPVYYSCDCNERVLNELRNRYPRWHISVEYSSHNQGLSLKFTARSE